MAGVFLSVPTDLAGLPGSIKRVRDQAADSVLGHGVQPMPVLIQPRIDGPGGVYFFDRQSGLDRLELSLRGPGAVTSGTSIVSDQLPVESPSGRMALAACRELARKLGGSGDFELVIPLDCCVFLQYRPLTRPISESLPEGASCGTSRGAALTARRHLVGRAIVRRPRRGARNSLLTRGLSWAWMIPRRTRPP